MSNSDRVLDATNLVCPMPLLKARLALKDMLMGETLLVKATDSSSWVDIQKYVSQSEHRLLSATQVGDVYQMLIQKG